MSDYFFSFTALVGMAAIGTRQFIPIMELLDSIENEENQ